MNLPQFRERALCTDHPDPDIWFPEKGGTTTPAKHICNGDDDHPPCPAKDECLAWALAHREGGIWGGTSEQERKAMRVPPPRRGPHGCGTTTGYNRHRKQDEEPCRSCQQANTEYHREYRRRQRGAA